MRVKKHKTQRSVNTSRNRHREVHKTQKWGEMRRNHLWNTVMLAPDGGASGGEPGTDPAPTEANKPDEGGEDEPTLEELKAQLRLERAKAAKNKAALDNALSEKGKLQKQLRSKQTAEEAEEEAKLAAEEAMKNELAELRKGMRINGYSKRLMGMGASEETATEIASLLPDMEDADGFFDSLAKFVSNYAKQSGENAIAKLLKDRPDINAGRGDSAGNSPAVDYAASLAKGQKSKNTSIIDKYKI